MSSCCIDTTGLTDDNDVLSAYCSFGYVYNAGTGAHINYYCTWSALSISGSDDLSEVDLLGGDEDDDYDFLDHGTKGTDDCGPPTTGGHEISDAGPADRNCDIVWTTTQCPS